MERQQESWVKEVRELRERFEREGREREERKWEEERERHERERERAAFMFMFLSSLVFCAGAIGGFMVVGQMLKDCSWGPKQNASG